MRAWPWMLVPERATGRQKADWRTVDRYSFAEVTELADQEAFHRRRFENRSEELRRDLRRVFRPASGFSAAELAAVLAGTSGQTRADWVGAILRQCCVQKGGGPEPSGLERLEPSRILHSLGSALRLLGWERDPAAGDILDAAWSGLTADEASGLESLGLKRETPGGPRAWDSALRDLAFENVGRTIVMSRERMSAHPRNALREDEIVWGRAPARLDLGGGWTDTPPYSLERGGCVINAAVDLNGQAPIQAYARVIRKPEVRINSIDHSTRVVVRDLDDLLDYRRPGSQFALAKAALALSGFSLEAASWPRGATMLERMLRRFGGGIG